MRSGLIYWVIPLISLLFLAVIINWLRQRKMLETHALLWIITFGIVVCSPFLVPALDRIAHHVGISYPPTLYLLVAIFFLMANAVRNTYLLSRMADLNRRLTQELGLLRHEVAALKKQLKAENPDS